MPRRMILTRLGHRKDRTVLSAAQRDVLEQTMAEGFSLCRPQGCRLRATVAEHRDDGIVLEDGTVFSGTSLARLLRHSGAAAITAATAGPEIVQAAAEAVARGDGVTAVIYDAVGGQTAEAAMSWICNLLRQQLRRRGENLTQHRYSPGYGDFHISVQRAIFDMLQLDRLGLSLTPSYMLIPEKSVTALSGIEQIISSEE